MIAIWKFKSVITFEVELVVPTGIVHEGTNSIAHWLDQVGPIVKYKLVLADAYDGLRIVALEDDRKRSQIRLPGGQVLYERHI